MKILLTLTDFSIPSYQIKLRFTFQGNGYSISTSSLLNLPVSTLTPGVPLEISGSDLAPYLSSQNLIFTGIDVADYELRKVLPEGPCSICVEVVDYSNPNLAVLSNPACSQVWFSLNDPPLLNTPFCGNQITPTDPQQVMFSWTPLHMNSPNSLGTQYVFELFEIRPEDADPNQVVNSTLPIFMQVTDQTYINYGIIEPQLQIGMSYVWRVKAQDIQGRDFFRNNGYSTVCTFTYGNIAASLADGIVLELNSNGTGVRQGMAWWNASSTFTHYNLEVRKTGNDDYEWFPYNATSGDTKINGLEPATQYECRVQGCINEEYESEWSNISIFTTQPAPDYACASTTLPPTQQNIIPLTNAISGMYFTIGQFELFVTDIEPLNQITQPGHYKGTGKIAVGFAIINLRVKFDDILVDENLMVRSGKVEAITQGIEAWENSLIVPDEYVDGTITDWEWSDDSTSLMVWVDGVMQEFIFPEDGELIIQDEEGSIYIFNEDGTYEVISILVYSTDNLAATKDYRIDFSADEDQKFGFDKKQYAAWIKEYEVIRLDDATNYFVSYKSLAPSETDYVVANITSLEPLTNITFVASESGTVLSSEELNDSTYRITISNLQESDFIYAYDNQNKIGKLWIKVLPLIEKEIVIVPVNGSNLTNISELEEDLNEIYAQANVKFTVTIAENFQNTIWDLNADGKLQNGDAELMTNYSEEMRALRDNYFAAHADYNKDAYHLFVIPTFLETDLAGYMVRGKGVGFLKNGEDANTTAHELAHGVFALEHTFPEVDKGTSNNLMDYNGGTHLTQRQWWVMHSDFPAFSFLDSEEDAEKLDIFSQTFSVENLDEIAPSENFQSSDCIDFYSQFNHVLTLPEPLKQQIDSYQFSGNYLVSFFVSDYSGKETGKYTIATTVSGITSTNLGYTATGQNGSSYFLQYSGLIAACPLKDSPIGQDSCIRYPVKLPNGSTTNVFNYVPAEFVIKVPSVSCNQGDNVIFKIENGVAVCRELTLSDCQFGNGTGGTISPDAVVSLVEIQTETIYGDNTVAWLNYENEPIKTGLLSNLIVSNILVAFEHNGHQYVAATVQQSDHVQTFAYVDKGLFDAKKTELGRELKVSDLTDEMLFHDFEKANSGDKVHYRLYNEVEECVSFAEYEFTYDGREKYELRSSPAGPYYFEGVDGIIVINKSCAFEILGAATCDALMMGAEGIGQIVDQLLAVTLIPEKYWNPMATSYDATVFSIFVGVSTAIDFGNLNIEAKQLSFAYLIGLFNGIVTELGGVGYAMAMISQLVCDADMRSQVWEAISNFSELVATIIDSFEEDWNSMNAYQRSELSGRTTIAIASIVIPLTKIKWVSIITKGTKVIKTFSKELMTFLVKVDKQLIEGFQIIGDDIRRLVYGPNGLNPYNLAAISDDGTLIIDNANRWYDSFDPEDVVDNIGSTNYKVGDGGVAETDELVVVQKSDGQVGFGRKNTVASFIDLNLSQKLEAISQAWTAAYPQIFFERRFFEDVMGYYRYQKSLGWGHTGDISSNFKAVDFYKNFDEVENDIIAETVVSMKTTHTTDVNAWLNSTPIKDNLEFLKDGLNNGINSNGKLLLFNNAEIHIYMPLSNLTPELKNTWLTTLNSGHPEIKFEINALEEFIQ